MSHKGKIKVLHLKDPLRPETPEFWRISPTPPEHNDNTTKFVYFKSSVQASSPVRSPFSASAGRRDSWLSAYVLAPNQQEQLKI